MKLLVIASDAMEFSGIRARARSNAPLVLLGPHQLLLAAHGVGARCAAAAVDASSAFRPDAIVSTGFCGALDPGLAIADIVVADSVVSPAGARYPATPVAGGTRCSVCSLDHVVQTAAEKRKLAAAGFGAVEMEAAGVAARAQSLHLPFYCIRAVSDLAEEDLANDFNRALTSDGHFDTIKLLLDSFRRPVARIPELLRLRKRCVRAARSLGDFFADCRF
jgi:adenosylhomocysteine nucleosidase